MDKFTELSTLSSGLRITYTYRMATDDVDPSALGEILSTMIAAGASNEVLGKFALIYRNRQHVALPSPIVEMGPVLEAFAESVANKLGRGAQANPVATVTRKTATPPKIVRLSVNGKQTSVSLSQDLFKRAAQALGSEEAATQAVKQLALQAPANTPRSNYAQHQLIQTLDSMAASLPPSALH